MEVFVITTKGDKLQLRNLVQDSLVLDIRSPLAFIKSHLSGARPMNFPQLLTKRMLKTHKSQDFTINTYLIDPTDPIRQRQPDTNIIIYNDDGAASVEDPILAMYMHIFSWESPKRVVSFVLGGFKAIEQSGHYALKSGDEQNYVPMPPSPLSPFPRRQEDPARDFNYIEPNLAVGAETAAHNYSLIKSEGFTHILNVSSYACVGHPDITCLWKNISDTPSQSLFEVLPDCVMFIDTALKQGHKILVHCQAGISRSVSMVIAYYMWSQQLSYSDALTRIQGKRGKAGPNLSFMGQLMILERCLKETNYDLILSCKLAADKLNLPH